VGGRIARIGCMVGIRCDDCIHLFPPSVSVKGENDAISYLAPIKNEAPELPIPLFDTFGIFGEVNHH